MNILRNILATVLYPITLLLWILFATFFKLSSMILRDSPMCWQAFKVNAVVGAESVTYRVKEKVGYTRRRVKQ